MKTVIKTQKVFTNTADAIAYLRSIGESETTARVIVGENCSDYVNNTYIEISHK